MTAWWAFLAGVALGATIVAGVWIWSSLRRTRSAFDVASGKALDMLGQVWAVPREVGETDHAYRGRLFRLVAAPASRTDVDEWIKNGPRRSGARRFRA